MNRPSLTRKSEPYRKAGQDYLPGAQSTTAFSAHQGGSPRAARGPYVKKFLKTASKQNTRLESA